MDILKGILIFLVVAAHYEYSMFRTIIYWFHMPLFFLVSGVLCKKDSVWGGEYWKNCLFKYLIPHLSYMCLLFPFYYKGSLRQVIRLLYGGRWAPGVWWYTPCLMISLCYFMFLKSRYSRKITIFVVITGGILAVMESHVLERISFLVSPGIPWNADVALLAVVYIAIGFYMKETVLSLLEEKKIFYDKIALFLLIIVSIFIYVSFRKGIMQWDFRMKQVCYKEFVLSVVVPCIFGFILCRMIYWMHALKVLRIFKNVFMILGRMTMPIMYLHLPLTKWLRTQQRGMGIYILISLLVSFVFVLIAGRIKWTRKLFGLQNGIGQCNL